MTKHLFGMVLTHQGIYANNRGENEGNASTLQKVLRKGELYTTVSAEAIRYALREEWQINRCFLNRTSPDHRRCEFSDSEFENWKNFLDDDVLGFMHAREETKSRRGILEITRAISTTPWRGEIMHNFASPGSNPAVTAGDPIPYAVEVHDTRYQYGFAMTPEFLGREGLLDQDTLTTEEKLKRLRLALEGLLNLRRVGGNHARYLTDFSPEGIVLRWTDDPVPRFLYCFEQNEEGSVSLNPLLARINGGDIDPSDLVIGTSINIPELRKNANQNDAASTEKPTAGPKGKEKNAIYHSLADAPTTIEQGVKRAVKELLVRISNDIK
jgi:CRISPR-associated protein Cst2